MHFAGAFVICYVFVCLLRSVMTFVLYRQMAVPFGTPQKSAALVQSESIQLAVLSGEKFKDLFYSIYDSQREGGVRV